MSLRATSASYKDFLLYRTVRLCFLQLEVEKGDTAALCLGEEVTHCTVALVKRDIGDLGVADFDFIQGYYGGFSSWRTQDWS